MGFLETSDLAMAASFRARVAVGITRAASSVLMEDQSEMIYARAEKRYQLATVALRDPVPRVDLFVWPILSNASIAEKGLDASDSDIEYQIGQIWDLVSGVTRAEMIKPSEDAVPVVPETGGVIVPAEALDSGEQ